MLEALLAALVGVALGAGLTALLFTRRDRSEPVPPDGPTFGEVCLAAAQAKADHEDGGHPAVDREYIDGADAVLGKLLQMGYGDDPLEMRLAYLAGGEDIEFDVSEVTADDLEELADLVGEQLADDHDHDPRRQL